MSKYSIRLCDVCTMLYNEKDYYLNVAFKDMSLPELNNPFDTPDVDTIISKVRTKIFNFTYPLPNNSEDKKVELETKIIKHYFMREIGFDSWGRFKLALNERLNMMMPYFNDLYKSIELQGDNPLSNNEITEVKKSISSSENTGSATSNDTTNTKQVFEDTPTSSLGNEDYATNITKNNLESNNASTNQGTSRGTDDMTRTITGLSNYSKQEMIARYRENIINVDEAIVNELYDLFLLIYD